MHHAPAPSGSRSSLRRWLLLLVVSAWPALLLAQQPKGDPAKGGDAGASAKGEADKAGPGDTADEREKKGVVDETKPSTVVDPEQRFHDPNADAALQNTFPQLPAPSGSPSQRDMETMAAGGAADRAQIASYIAAQAAVLTRHANLESMINTDSPKSAGVRELQQAAERLRRPLEIANERNNASFRRVYVAELAKIAPKLLNNHLYPRTWLMVALSRANEDEAVPVYIGVLNDEAQIAAAKLLASVGLYGRTQGGRTDVGNPQQGLAASRALADLLRREKALGWPVKFRALQAMGALRRTSGSANGQKAEVAEAALEQLADANAYPLVRAAAAWAIGMMRIDQPQFNFALVAQHAGLAAADIAEKIADVHAVNPDLAARYTDALVMLNEAFTGDMRIRGTGLLNANSPSLNAQRERVQDIARRVKALTLAAIELTRSAGSQAKQARTGLRNLAAETRAALMKTPPSSFSLVPGGDEIRVVAARPAAEPKDAADEAPAPKNEATTKGTGKAADKGSGNGPG